VVATRVDTLEIGKKPIEESLIAKVEKKRRGRGRLLKTVGGDSLNINLPPMIRTGPIGRCQRKSMVKRGGVLPKKGTGMGETRRRLRLLTGEEEVTTL